MMPFEGRNHAANCLRRRHRGQGTAVIVTSGAVGPPSLVLRPLRRIRRPAMRRRSAFLPRLSVQPDPRADVPQDTLATFRTLRVAYLPAVASEAIAEVGSMAPRHEFGESVFLADRVPGSRSETEPERDSEPVRIRHDSFRLPEPSQDETRCSRFDTQRPHGRHRVRHFPSVVRHEHFARSPDRTSAPKRAANGSERGFQLSGTRGGHAPSVGVAGEEQSSGPVDSWVGVVGGEYGCDQKLERRVVAETAAGLAIDLSQHLESLASVAAHLLPRRGGWDLVELVLSDPLPLRLRRLSLLRRDPRASFFPLSLFGLCPLRRGALPLSCSLRRNAGLSRRRIECGGDRPPIWLQRATPIPAGFDRQHRSGPDAAATPVSGSSGVSALRGRRGPGRRAAGTSLPGSTRGTSGCGPGRWRGRGG